MKNRFISAITAFALALSTFAVPAIAADDVIKIEAEDYISQKGGFTVTTGSDYSGGKGVVAWITPQSGQKYVLEYEVTVPKSGNYKIGAVASERGVAHTTDWNIAVGTEDNTAAGYEKLGDVTNSSVPKVMKRYSMGSFKLSKGTNTLYVSLNASDKQQTNQLVSYFDYFTIEKGEAGAFSLSKVEFKGEGSAEIGVFEKGKEVKINMVFSAPAPEIKKYFFKITDLWEREVSEGEIVIGKGNDIQTVNLGTFNIGWYKLDILDNGKSIGNYYAFSVTQPLSQRKQFDDTTLATDAAIEYDLGSRKRNTAFIKALKLAGYDWVRERGAASLTPEDYLAVKRERDAAGIKALDVVAALLDTSFRSDLFEQAYDFWYKAPEQNGGVIDVYEIYNETDIGSSGTADDYAAYMKAAAIALSDTEQKPYKTMTGLASYWGGYIDTIMQNGILDYSDIYNYHSHDTVSLRASKAKIYNNGYSKSPLPTWNGETGLHQPVDENGNLSNGQMRVGTRHAITSAMESISNGTTKHFWFLFRPYIENAGNFSCFHTSYMPYPMYSALSNMTYQLGEAVIKGEITNMPEGMVGWMFDDGDGNDVACLYTTAGQNYIYLDGDSVKYSDMLGYEEVKTAENGKIKISVSQDPVFVKFSGRSSESNYYPFEFSRELVNKTFEPHERVIMQQVWDYKSISDVKSKGYIFDPGVPQTVTLNVYNFNKTLPVTGVIGIYTDKNIESDIQEAEINIEPWSKQTLTFTLKATENAVGGASGNIMFYGHNSDGEEFSKSISMYQISSADRTIAPEDRFNFEDYWKEENWDLSNIASGGKITVTSNEEEKSASFKIKFSNQNWAFPFFYIDDPSIFEGTAGFVFDRTCESGITSEITQMYIYMKDGRNYYSGAKSANAYTEGEKTIVFPWSTFTLYYSPLGGVDIREFKFEDISHISIGISGGAKDQPVYTIKNFGCFYSDLPSDQMNQAKYVTFEGIEDGAVFEEGKVPTLVATVPEDNIVNIRVMDFDNEFTDYKVNGSKVEIDLSKLKRGKHRIYVFAENDFCYRYYGQLDFYVS